MSNSTISFYDLPKSFSISDIIVISTYFLLNLAVGIWVRDRGVDMCSPRVQHVCGCSSVTAFSVSHHAG